MISSDNSYQIRQATVADWPSIADFIARTYGTGAPFKHRARWDWQFSNGPFGLDEGQAVPVWIALANGEVVGQVALQPGRLWVQGEALPAGWIVDVMVDERHRGKGLSHKITSAMVATGRTLVTLTMAAATRRMMERAGCITLPPVKQMVRPRRLSGRTVAILLDRLAETRPAWQWPIAVFNKSGIGPAALAACINGAAAIARISPRRRTHPRLQGITSLSAETVHRLSKQLVATTNASFDRSPAFMKWRFVEVPDLDYHFAELQGHNGARSLLVTRDPLPAELAVGTITDLMCDPNDAEAMAASIDHAIRAMERNCEAIIAGASDPRFVSAYAARGFLTVRTHHPTVVSNDPALLERLSKINGPWHFSKADHDWDQVHPADH